MTKNIPRLYCRQDLEADTPLVLGYEQTHYLLNVMRRHQGDKVLVFDGFSGEWEAHIAELSKKQCILELGRRVRLQEAESDLWLLFALIKPQRLEYLIEKATELGVSRLCPVITDHTSIRRTRLERLQALAIEAAEQSNRLSIPHVDTPSTLIDLLSKWDSKRELIIGDERGSAAPISNILSQVSTKPSAILVGPEGGFSEKEFSFFDKAPFIQCVSLGPRILRTETAAVAMLSCWQAFCSK